MQITQNQIKALKRGETIEIEKEWVDCVCKHWREEDQKRHYGCNGKGKIQKYKVGDEITINQNRCK